MIVKTIKRGRGRNIIVFSPDNGQGFRLEMSQNELIRFSGMLEKLLQAGNDGQDTLIERRESTIGLNSFRGM